jgi:predicted permease
LAVSLVLCTSAALLLRSLWTLQSASLGFETAQTLFTDVSLGRHGYPQPEQRAAFFNALEESLRSLPNVSALGVSDSLPPSGRQAAMIFANLEVEGRPRLKEGTGGMVPFRVVSESFFSVLGIPILRGRAFSAEDRQPGNPTIILNRLLAARLFGSDNALGKRIRLGREGPWHTVVGVSADIRNSGLAPHDGEYYLPRAATDSGRRAHFLLRTNLSASALDPWFQQAVRRLNPTIPAQLHPLASRVEDLSAQPRFEAVLLTLFASTGLLLSLLGLYGVIAYLVTQRTREMGLRLALGATHSNVIVLFIRQALQWSLAGICIGLGLSYFATTYLRAHLYNVSPRDPGVWALSVLLLILAALLAAWLPARRAGRIAPSEALRS